MNILRRVKAELFREPNGDKWSVVPIGFGLLLILVLIGGILFTTGWSEQIKIEPRFILLAFAFLCMGTAEILAADRRKQAGLLRISSITFFLLFGGVTIGSVLLSTEGKDQQMMAFYFVLAALIAITLWLAWIFWKSGREQ
ncbi:hypothetical protein NDI76_21925 [Halogeometricum sp. S1BR25-6]|uniref:Uncharacterized protein n=1 Tax=Halogeometricum salsisoli TaxID=2950536 RepID=A0ABU2GKP7_9EURY|nr:hypothetical protein [Halogeometricum sp. S1BR25-6]MDS0301392.1 hypothetical protein [Halogeometricum sp. S1BR25-6]